MSKLVVTRQLVLVSYLLMLLMQVLPVAFYPPEGKVANPTVAAVLVIPLLIFLPGILRRDPRSHVMICFALIFYFLIVVENIFMPNVRSWDWVELVALTVLFIAAMMYSRWRAQEIRGQVEAATVQETEG